MIPFKIGEVWQIEGYEPFTALDIFYNEISDLEGFFILVLYKGQKEKPKILWSELNYLISSKTLVKLC